MRFPADALQPCCTVRWLKLFTPAALGPVVGMLAPAPQSFSSCNGSIPNFQLWTMAPYEGNGCFLQVLLTANSVTRSAPIPHPGVRWLRLSPGVGRDKRGVPCTCWKSWDSSLIPNSQDRGPQAPVLTPNRLAPPLPHSSLQESASGVRIKDTCTSWETSLHGLWEERKRQITLGQALKCLPCVLMPFSSTAN